MCLIGLLLIFFEVYSSYSYSHPKNFVSTIGTVTGGTTYYFNGKNYICHPKFTYYVDGYMYEYQTGGKGCSKEYNMGEEVKILADPRSPGNAPRYSKMSENPPHWINSLFPLILFPLIFLISGIFLLIYNAIYFLKIKRLKATGKKISANIVNIQNFSWYIFILAEFHEGDKVYQFKSMPLYGDASSIANIKYIDIFINPKNYRDYYMDVPGLDNLNNLNS